MLVETFPRGNRHYLVAYPFEGRLAHQTLGMLLTRRLDRLGALPLGIVANDYGLSVWAAGDISHMIALGSITLGTPFEEDMLGDDLDAWLAESSLMKRTFRITAVIAGLIERASSRAREARPSGYDVHRFDLRRLKKARTCAHPARCRLGRCGERTAQYLTTG